MVMWVCQIVNDMLTSYCKKNHLGMRKNDKKVRLSTRNVPDMNTLFSIK